MEIRRYRSSDARGTAQLFYNTVHTVNGADYAPEQLNAWAPADAPVVQKLRDTPVAEKSRDAGCHGGETS